MVTNQWGRKPWGEKEPSRMPGRKPVWTIAALVIAVLASALTALYQYQQQTWLERTYLPFYLKTGLLAWMKVEKSDYQMPMLIEPGKKPRFVVEADSAALRAKKAKGEWQRWTWNNRQLHASLQQYIYRGETPLWPLSWKVGLGMFVVALVWAAPKERRRQRLRKEGRRLKGPEAVTAQEFNRRNKSDGVGFWNEDRSLTDKILGRGKKVRIPREQEASHILILGDSGSGKSTAIRGMLEQIEARGETAIVYDPALDYTPQFYRPERGDVILNPLDQRMPYWSPCAEVEHEAEAEGLAAALFKDDPRSNPFFVMVPRQIFAHLLTEDRKRTPEELLAILRDERELGRRLKDTEHASAIHPEAGPQRGGMMATLNSVASALKLLPGREETTREWTATGWAKQRQGWLFITSPPAFRQTLLPIISMWLDVLVLRLMNEGQSGPRPVWFMLDELASLHHLPQLHTAITENRKSGNPVVLGFQGRSQLEASYGHKAEVMLSQPATKIFLRTSEPNAAQWISDAIGKQEVERVRESRTSGKHNSESETFEHVAKILVMDSEIMGLANLHGYLKSGNLVVRLRLPYLAPRHGQEAFLPRATEAQRKGAAAAAAQGQSYVPPPKPPQREEPPKPPRAAQSSDDDEPYFD